MGKAICTLQRAEPWARMIAEEGPMPIWWWLERSSGTPSPFVAADDPARVSGGMPEDRRAA